MRPLRVVASAALIAALASVAVPGLVGSRPPSRDATIGPEAFSAVGLDSLAGAAWMTTLTPDPASAADARLEAGDRLLEPAPIPVLGSAPPRAAIPGAKALVINLNPWHHNPEESWYGPGFWGQHTACGQILTESLRGVAHRSLPCGTMVSFRNPSTGEVVTVPVVDRGPYVAGRMWDLTKAACAAIHHCYTGPLDWRYP